MNFLAPVAANRKQSNLFCVTQMPGKQVSDNFVETVAHFQQQGFYRFVLPEPLRQAILQRVELLPAFIRLS